jgi:hypothetical protein
MYCFRLLPGQREAIPAINVAERAEASRDAVDVQLLTFAPVKAAGLIQWLGVDPPAGVSDLPKTQSGRSEPVTVPANGTLGNLGRNAFRAPGITQLDLGVSKFVLLTERFSMLSGGRVQPDEPGSVRTS